MAMAILTSRPNSHPFEERKLVLTEASKVGRSVAKSRPAPNNCVFDCKVLSRNHAIIWFENEKFFLRDTKSSNGTFVNNVRLSKGSEESEPKQLNSGDIIQFGVDVVENSKKVTHGCIIANITLYLADGSEATRSPLSRNLYKVNENGIPTQDIWQLSQYLQDALYREQMLENRLTALQRLITSSQNILDDNSQKFAQEDKLLSRLEMLENQVETLTRNLSEDDIKRKLLTLQEDRHTYEMRSKESLKRMLQEKLEAVQKLSDAERSCNNAEDECFHYKTLYDKSQLEMRELNERHAQRLEEMKSLQEQVEKAEKRHAAVDEQASKERKDFESNMKEAQEKEATFAARAESLQAECDVAKHQLTSMKAQLDKRREGVHKAGNPTKKEDSDEVNDKPVEFTIRQGVQLGDEPSLFEDIPISSNGNLDQSSSDDLKILQAQVGKLEEEVEQKEKHVDNLREQLIEIRTLLKDSQHEITSLNDKLTKAKQEVDEDKLQISDLEEQVMEYHLQAVDQLTFTDGTDQEENGEIEDPPPSPSKESTLSASRLQDLLDKIVEVNNRVRERRKSLLQWTDSEDAKTLVLNETLVNSYNDHEDDESTEQCSTVHHGLDFIHKIKENFSEIERIVDIEHQEGQQIKEEFKNAQTYTKDFKQQILELQDKLLEEQELTRQKDEYLASLRRDINELSHERNLMQVEKNCEHQAFESARNAAREMQKQAAKSAESAGKNKVELSALSDDNLLLKQKMQTLESELKKYRRDNSRLSTDYSKLQTSHRELELQERAQHEKHIEQQHALRDKVDLEALEKQDLMNKVDDAGEKLKTCEESVKVQEDEWRKNIELEKERVSKLQSYLLSVVALVFAMVLAFSLDLISISPGGRFGSS